MQSHFYNIYMAARFEKNFLLVWEGLTEAEWKGKMPEKYLWASIVRKDDKKKLFLETDFH